MAITLTVSELAGLGIIANHCDQKKFDIAVNEAIEFDLKNILGNLFNPVNDNWDQGTGIYADIILPKTYQNCLEYDTTHQGLKKVLAYYSYSRYIMINSFDDTPNGLVGKTNNFSIPKSLEELKQFSSKYRNMGKDSWVSVEAYILLNRDSYPEFDCSCSQPCGCNGSCGKPTRNKGFGLRSSTIIK